MTEDISGKNLTRPAPYCCIDHALCSIGLPGPDGAHARNEIDRLESDGAAQWCGKVYGPHGELVFVDLEDDVSYHHGRNSR